MSKTIAEIEAEVELEKIRALADDAEFSLKVRLATRWEKREYLFDGPINYASVSDFINTVDDWRRLDADKPNKKIHITFNGSSRFIQSLALFDYIRWLKLDGFEVTIELAGRAAGQSAVFVAAANRRLMTPSSWYQLEEIALGMPGNTFEADNEIRWNERLELQFHRILAERSRVLPEEVTQKTALKTWTVDAAEALALGLVDEIVTTRPAALRAPVELDFDDIPEAETTKEHLSVACIRKMRAEARLQQLITRDRHALAINNGIVRFIDSVTTESVGKAKGDLEAALRMSDKDITLLIDCNGGSCTDGLGYIDMCRQVNASGRVLNTECIGYAASMGSVMLQCGKKRTMGRESWLLIHKVSSWFGDATTMAKLHRDYCLRLEAQCFGILAERSIFTVDQITAKCRDHDWWLTAEEALQFGFIDAIR